MSRFTEILTVSPLADGNTWVTRKDFGYDIGEEGSGNTVNVPIGFMTDFTSVPRFLWSFLPRWGKYGNAAVIHDYCYWEQRHTREESDRIFLEAMQVLEVPKYKRLLIYYTVKWFGCLAWKGNKRMKTENKSRILKVMPLKSIVVKSLLLAQK